MAGSLREQLMSLFSRGAPAPQQPDSPLVAQIPNGAEPQPQAQPDGPMTDEDLVTMLNEDMLRKEAQQRQHRRAPQRDERGMDALMMQLQDPSSGITEGPNANIQDDSRARALAQVAALRG